MIASKVICDDTYSNKSRAVVSQGMFSLREINRLERELCPYLDWEITFGPSVLADFEASVKRDGKGPGPYPAYSPQLVSGKVAAPSSSSTSPPSNAGSHPAGHAHSPHVPPDDTSSAAVAIPKSSFFTVLPNIAADDVMDEAYPHVYEQSLDRLACALGGKHVLG
jgi:hypothetical protein